MKTKKEFFADYFKNQIEQLTYELNDYASNAADYKMEVVHDRLTGLTDEWENCVLQDAKDGYPVIDMWNEYVEEQHEQLYRRQLEEKGFGLKKSHEPEGIDNLGGYMITNLQTNAVVQGSRFELTLEDVENYLITI